MPASVRPLRLTAEWDGRFTRMCGVSLVAHVLTVVAVVLLSVRSGPGPLPLVAYTVEITDPNALGGRRPPGLPARDLSGGAAKPHAPEPKVEPAPPPAPAAAEPPKPPEPPPAPKVETPRAEVPEPPKPPEPETVAKAEPKPEPKPEPKAPEPEVHEPEPLAKPEAKKPDPPKPEARKPEPPRPAERPTGKPAASGSPAAQAATPDKPAAGAANGAAGEADAYAAAAERWRSRVASGAGGGLGGADTDTGPVGSGGDGGGGGQLVGLEFLAYRQQVINTIKGRWTNMVPRPGLVAIVRFEISPAGEVSGVRLEQGSGNAAYDGSALRAVQRSSPLPAPPARYAREFREFLIEFHSEEQGGQGAG